MKIFTEIPFDINFSSLMRKAHIKPDSGYEQSLEKIFNTALSIAKPKAILKESYVECQQNDTVAIDGITFTSQTLRKNLDEIQCVFPYVATCGTELDSIIIKSDDLLEAYFFDAIKETLLQSAINHLDQYIHKKYGLSKTTSMNPGSSELFVWPLEQQKELFLLFPTIQDVIGVKLTESFLMTPNKSLSGIKFDSDTEFHNCRLCERKKCPTRFEPFDQKLFETTLKSMDIQH